MNATNNGNNRAVRSQQLSRNLERKFWDAVQYMEEFSLLMEEVDKKI